MNLTVNIDYTLNINTEEAQFLLTGLQTVLDNLNQFQDLGLEEMPSFCLHTLRDKLKEVV